jgi:hypothetical protein
LVPQLVAGMAAQISAGSGMLVGTFVQVPFVPASAQDLQASLHGVEQQTPCAQTFEAHSALSEQVAPGSFLPQEFPLQTLPWAQSASALHVMAQREPLQANGAQVIASGATQAPLAVQSDSGVDTPLSQRSGAQTVPAAYRRQMPPMSQRPSVLQEAAPRSTQTPRRSGLPAATAVQCPIADGSAQLRQEPMQALSQQTPSTQFPLSHSPPCWHDWPTGLGPQLPATQTLPVVQSLSDVHRLTQAAAPALHL